MIQLHRYLSIDSWDTEDQREAFLKEHKEGYSSLDATFQEWTDKNRCG
jgi:hypothetical protein